MRIGRNKVPTLLKFFSCDLAKFYNTLQQKVVFQRVTPNKYTILDGKYY